MSKTREISNTNKLVNEILQMDKKARNSDSYLYYVVCNIMAKKRGIDLDQVKVSDFLLKQNEMGLPPFETVRRTRQKAQEKHPELAADANVEAQRELNQEAFIEFARRG